MKIKNVNLQWYAFRYSFNDKKKGSMEESESIPITA